jgi:hypothetical protein
MRANFGCGTLIIGCPFEGRLTRNHHRRPSSQGDYVVACRDRGEAANLFDADDTIDPGCSLAPASNEAITAP